MNRRQTASNCRWATPTLFLPAPIWLRAWQAPWTCQRETEPRTLESTVECAECPRWEPRPDEDQQPAAHGRPRSARHVTEL